MMKNDSYVDLLSVLEIKGAHPGGMSLTQQMLAEVTIHSDTQVLDAGCGTGETAAYLASTFDCHVEAIDHHPIMVEKASARCVDIPKTNIQQGSIENLPFPNNSFDFILSESVLAFLDAEKGLSEIYRVLKTEGCFILNEMTRIQTLTLPETDQIKKFYGVKAIYTENEWRKLLSKVGFSQAQNLDVVMGSEGIVQTHLPANISKEILSVLDEHTQLMNKFRNKLTFSVLKCEK